MHPLIEYLANKKFDLITTLLTSSLGFLAALIFNGALERRRERREFKNLLSSIGSEATSNGMILKESFLENIGGIITRPLTTVCTESVIASPLFVRYATKENCETVIRYYRQLVLLNGNRQLHYDLSLSAKDEKQQTWLRDLVEEMRQRISKAKEYISEVVALSQ
jgi:hypothetical protein